MTDDTAARLRALAEREAKDRHEASQWYADTRERDERDEWAYLSLMDLRDAIDGRTILALLDEIDALRRERDEWRNKHDAHVREASGWHRRMQQAEARCAAAHEGKARSGGMSLGRALANSAAHHYRSERDAAMALLHRWDALIVHQYTGSRAAMDAMHQCAQETRALLGGGEAK